MNSKKSFVKLFAWSFTKDELPHLTQVSFLLWSKISLKVELKGASHDLSFNNWNSNFNANYEISCDERLVGFDETQIYHHSEEFHLHLRAFMERCTRMDVKF